MTTDEAQRKRASELHEVAEELNAVAVELRGVKKSAVPRWMGYVLIVLGVLIVAALITVVAIALPVFRTANIVERVAGPAAQKAAAQSQSQVVSLILCNNRANLSEARVMDGLAPLPLRKGCDPYNFDPQQPILPPPTTSTTAPRRSRARSTSTSPSSTTDATTATTTPTTVRTTTTTCPTVQMGDTCLTVP